jgi:hypothetical protein
MKALPQSAETILKELRKIYVLALRKKQYTVALKIQELLGQEIGLFARKNKETEKSKLAIEALSDEDITKLIDDIEKKLKTV